jgi:uncharacterized protein
MLLEIKRLLETLGRQSAITGSGGGGSKDNDNDKAKDKDKDKDDNNPIKNFDYNRFRSSRPRPENAAGGAAGSGDDKDADDKDADDSSSSSRARGSRTANNSPFDFTSFNGRRFGNSGGTADVQLPRVGRRGIFLSLLGILIVTAFLLVPRLLNLWVDVLWFEEVGQTGVFWTRIWIPLVVWIGAFALAFAVIFLNITLARRFGPAGPVITRSPDNPLSVFLSGGLRFLNIVFIIGSVIISAILAGGLSANWETIAFFFNSTPWTDTEPIFGNTVGFYIFDVPFYSVLQGWFVGLLLVALIAAMAVYFLRYTLANQNFEFTRPIKVHAAVLGALTLGLFAFGYQIATWNLVYSNRSRLFTGTSATDFEAQAPANTILTFIVAGAALLLIACVFIRNQQRSTQIMLGAGAIWLIAHIAVGSIYPALYQNFSVTPNAITKERRYIENTLDQTRRAYNMEIGKGLQVVPFQGTAQLTQQAIQNNPSIQENARLWDYEKLKNIYNLTQALRPYYTFDDVDIDRYNIDLGSGSKKTQVMISPRELRPEGITNQTWQSLRLQYTHGYGLQASPVNQVDNQGRPRNIISQGFPYTSTTLPLTQPRIYFGQSGTTRGYSVVNTNLNELDYPFQQAGAPEATYRYTGKGGVRISNFFVKGALATYLGDFNLLISDAINDNSRVIFRRTVQERIGAIAPFLQLDPDPYTVVADGRIYWIQDAYTTSDLYPHSDRQTPRAGDRYNYIRNSVKITVDAYDGTVNFYLMDKPGVDPIAAAYASIYPSLFKPYSQMPDSLKGHIRYPEALFKIQQEIYAQYHVTDPTVFFNRQDVWQIPADPRPQAVRGNSQQFEPYYLITRLPDQQQEEFVLINVFQPQNRPTLVAQMIGRSDGDNYGQLLVYNYDQSVNIDGPAQFYSKLQALPDFSRQQSLLNTGSSQLPPGPIVILPVEKSVLYVMPYYLQSSSTSLPQLQFVASGVNEQVYVAQPGQEDNRQRLLPDALANVFTRGQQVSVPATGQPGGTTTPGTVLNPTPGAFPTPTLPSGTPPALTSPGTGTGSVPIGPTVGASARQNASVAELVRSISAHQEAARAAFAAGDAARGNAELQAANEDLARLNQILGR